MPKFAPSKVVPNDISKARKMWGGSHCFFVDVSKWQNVTNYSALADSIDAAIVKISGITSGGVLYEDSKAKNHIQQLTKRKTPCGGYHYCKFVGDDSRTLFDAKSQATFFVDACKKYPLTVIAPDMEPGELEAAIKAGMEPRDIEDWTKEFVSILKNETKNPLAMYASTACLNKADGGLDWLSSSDLLLWWAGYPRQPFSWPAQGPKAPMRWPSGWPLSNASGARWAWQYMGGDDDRTPTIDEGGKAPGNDGDIDCDITPKGGAFARALTSGIYKTRINWRGLFGGLALVGGIAAAFKLRR